MLSLGYSILMQEVLGALESKGLSPFFGFLHADREKHPTLASDLMEEWRAVIVDSTVMSLINGHEIEFSDFTKNEADGGVFLGRETMRIFLKKLEAKLMTSAKYLTYADQSVNFRRAINMQANELCKALEAGNPNLYSPIVIR